MESLLTYIIQVNLLLGIIYLGYIGLLKGLTFYFLNRAYFLVGGLFAFLYPFLDLKSLFVQRGLNMGVVGEQISLYMMEPEVQQQLTLGRLVEIIFMAGAVLLLLKFVFQLLSLLRIHLNSRSDQWRTYLFRNVLIPIVPFSFLNKIYVNKDQHLDAELKDIFKHEDIHVKGLHSLDILLFEMILVCCWYNPFVWLMRRAIRQNLEFLTDQQVLDKGIDKQTYQYSLLNVSKKGTSVGLSNQFNFKLLKRRIMMMNKKRSSKIELSKYAFLLPIFLLTGAAFTVSKAEGSIEGVVEKANETVLPIPLPTVDLRSQTDQSNMKATSLTDTLAKAHQVETKDFTEIKRSAIDFSKDQKYFVDNKLVSKAEFLAIPEGKLAKYWFSNDSDLIKYRTKSSIDIAGGAVLANTVEMQQHSDIAQKKLRCVMNGIVQEKTFTVDDIDPNAIASVSVLQGKAAIDKYGEDVGKDGILEVELKEGAHIGKDATRLKGNTIGIEVRANADPRSEPLYIVEGKEVNSTIMSAIPGTEIQSIDVIKNNAASIYGEKGKNGVILVKLKKNGSPKITNQTLTFTYDKKEDAGNVDKMKVNGNLSEVVVMGYKKEDANEPELKGRAQGIPGNIIRLTDDGSGKVAARNIKFRRVHGAKGNPLFVVDGEIAADKKIKDLDPNTIDNITILKDQNATALYGDQADNGVIIVNTKSYVKEHPEISSDVKDRLSGKVRKVIKTELGKEQGEAIKK
ncbi:MULTISPECIES: M56 family metallopeptidase [Sphingobacterium]|uniref:Antirepressor regulating drug resistance, predicted signal transduction N-terminal membrane component n=1 Tax=Sphingobacterium multivorum TaxID=28454 RepID=A0A2X2IZU2_SPHMU|nr:MULTISPECIES: M56 family metallopeptidase [Sphingobacterium]QRQ60445.1 TonB-dependent receptor plug domain-containing protein [Sphingobacterium multivorum]SPZ86924.1 Antirepressor regulating drug resistance, predicted signal transduction N-terminal membrane component [Sphingobacterium multivorum]